jgi:hypothetical protein
MSEMKGEQQGKHGKTACQIPRTNTSLRLRLPNSSAPRSQTPHRRRSLNRRYRRCLLLQLLIPMPHWLSLKLPQQRLEPLPLSLVDTREGRTSRSNEMTHLDADFVCCNWGAGRGGEGVRAEEDFPNGRDGRFTDEGGQIRAGKVSSEVVLCQSRKVDVPRQRCLPRNRLQDLNPLLNGGKSDVKELVESSGTVHGGVDAVGTVGSADDEDLFARFEAVEFGEEGVDDASGGFGL